MSGSVCPRAANWPALVAHRFERRGEEPAGFRDGLAHLEDCPECRRAALAADPTLVFQRLDGERNRPTGPARLDEREREISEMAEADSVRRAVAAMRTASRHSETRTTRAASWKRWAAAAVLALAALSTGSTHGLRELSTPSAPAAAVDPAALAAPDTGSRVPMIEDLDLAEARRVHQMDSPDMSVVMVFGEGLDV